MGNCYSRQFWAQRTIVNRAAACAGSLPGLRTIARPQYPPPPIFPPPLPPPDEDWWDVEEMFGCDGIFAYDSNAASYAASKVNFFNPGTYNLTTGGVPVPQWNPERWLFIEQPNSANQAVFLTGYTRPELQYNWTIAVRARDVSGDYCPGEDCSATTCFANAGDWNIAILSAWDGSGPGEYIWINFGDPTTPPFPPSPAPGNWHVYVMAGETLYVDGLPIGTNVADPQPYIVDGHHSPIFQIGGQWWQDTPNNAIGGSNEISKVIALDCILDYDQVRTLTERMGAVVADPVLSADQASVAITPTEATLTSSGEAGPQWWLPTGITNADCLWAYKAFGAASYADSKTNVNDPGTGTLEETAIGSPNWAAGSGWSWPAGGASPLLAPTVTNSGSAITVVVYCQQTGVGEAVAGSIYKNLSEVIIAPCVYILPQPSPGGGSRFCNGGATYDNIVYAIGYMSPLGVAGNKAYIDGYDAGITLDAWSGSQTGKFGIGGLCTHHQYMADNVTNEITTVRRILGAVAYKVTLTADQMLELNDNFVAWGY